MSDTWAEEQFEAHGISATPAPVPCWCRSWRHALVFNRIIELVDAEYRINCACWEGDTMVRPLPFDGVLFTELLARAKGYYDVGDLDEADRCGVEAELVMVQRVPS